MRTKRKEAAAPTATPKNNRQNESYRHSVSVSRAKRAAGIAQRRTHIPKAYRATYDRATEGKSLRAAVNAQCLECVCWRTKEVRDCTDLASPPYAVRPYQRSQNGRDEGSSGVEYKNSGKGGKPCL